MRPVPDPRSIRTPQSVYTVWYAHQASASILAELLQKAEVELVELRRRRSELESAERVAGEKVGHLRAALELETNGPARQVGKESASPASVPGSTTMRPEDLAAEILSERSPMHYKDLYAEWRRDRKRQSGCRVVDPDLPR